ncbi:MAG: GNAT family N-acetyltransferase [Acetobacteraceae bacterium]|nr:GNAT family N-acetyltransferase [Acetobacteraceae bacterium]
MDSPELRIVEGGLDDPRVIALLRHHLLKARETTPAENAHALDLSGLKAPDIRFWSAWAGEELLGCGAMRGLSPDEAEVKSMHTAEAARRRGVGSAILRHIMAEARAAGHRRLLLETGTHPYFAAAVALYRAHGFADCGPFGDYAPSPHNMFLARDL